MLPTNVTKPKVSKSPDLDDVAEHSKPSPALNVMVLFIEVTMTVPAAGQAPGTLSAAFAGGTRHCNNSTNPSSVRMDIGFFPAQMKLGIGEIWIYFSEPRPAGNLSDRFRPLPPSRS